MSLQIAAPPRNLIEVMENKIHLAYNSLCNELAQSVVLRN